MKVIFIVTHKWFEKYKSGEKTIEYRETKPYWDVRLNKPITTAEIRDGYKKNASKLNADVVRIEKVNGINTDLEINKMVYATHLSNIK